MKIKTIMMTAALVGSNLYALDYFDAAVISDSITTYYAIETETGVEANPLLPESAMGAAVTSAVISYGARYLGKNTPYCRRLYRTLSAMKFGAAANNLGVIEGSGDPQYIGVTFGFFMYQNPAIKREAVRYCSAF